MITGNTELSSTDKVIRALRGMSGDKLDFEVGQRGVTKIVAYDENGQMSHVPWLAIYVGEKIWLRMPAVGIAVYYL
jgi:hypothetical protein